MRKMLFLIAAVLTAAALYSADSHAWISARTGQRNFERAWSAFMSKQPDTAMEYFAKSADAYGLALDENPPSRTTTFPSSLTMAGISGYYAGRNGQVLEAMSQALDKDDSIWEAYIYTALAYARMNDKAHAEEFLEKYIKSNPAQPILSSEVQRQRSVLDDGAAVAGIVPPLESALFDQFHNNVLFVGRKADDPGGMCSGPFWWRNNRQPCDKSFDFQS